MKDVVEPRIAKLMSVLSWKQPVMAEYLGVTQPSVCRMANGSAESGPVSRLLDQLEQKLIDEGKLRCGDPCKDDLAFSQVNCDVAGSLEQVES